MHEFRSTILSGEPKAPTPVASKARKGEGATPAGLTAIRIKREETRVTNQRLEDRHRGLVERTTIHFRRRRHQVEVVNVSSRGAMIAADLLPRIGEKLDIEFTPDNRTKCIVRWVREGRFGVEFLEETIFWDTGRAEGAVFRYESSGEEAAPGRPSKEFVDREQRQTLLRAGTLYWSGISIPVRLRNISSTGARVESGRELVPGAEVELDLGEAGFQVAEVRWCRSGQVGLHFAEAFDLDSLAPGAAAVAVAVPEMLKPAYLETETQPDSPWAARFERLSLTEVKLVGEE
jgi:hypothetical protein